LVDEPADSGSGRLISVEPRLHYVRPGPNALTWLESTVADLKGGDPLRPITIIVPNDYAGQFARWRLGRRNGYIGVATLRLGQVVRQVAGPARAGRLGPIPPVVEANAARAAMSQIDRFKGLRQASVRQALVELFRELRRSEVIADGTTISPTTRDALDAFRAYRQLTWRYDNQTTIANAATARLRAAADIPPVLAALGALVLYLPTRLDPAEIRFLAAAARWLPFVAGFIEAADPGVGAVPSASKSDADRLASALGVRPPQPEWTGDRLPPGTKGRIIQAPDPTEEVREVIRHIVAEIAEVPLHRVVILYRQGDVYGGLVRDSLDAAGLPWVSSEGRRLVETRAGRALLGLLRLAERRFTRAAVLEWLETLPPLDGPIASVSPSTWDRLSRAANVSRGVEQWTGRLRRHADEIDGRAGIRESEGMAEAALDAARRQAREARLIADAIELLDAALRPPADGSTWTSFVDWAQGLRERFLGEANRWPTAEQSCLTGVAKVLENLRLADRVPGTPAADLSEFLAELEVGLGAKRVPTGEIGVGVVVEPVTAVAGLAFDRAYLLGLVAGAYPTPPPSDPIFPTGGTDPLHRRARHRADERRDYLVALASADGGIVTLGLPESDGQRAKTPSPWLLAFAEQLAGAEPVSPSRLKPAGLMDTAAFRDLAAGKHPWLRVVRSAQDGAERAGAPADLEDRRLADVVSWHRYGLSLPLHPLARRPELPLGRALFLDESRRSSCLSDYDGNVSAVASKSRRLAGSFAAERPVSAKAIQTWATCGFQFFVERVLRVEPTERPEEVWTIEALDRGNVIHEVLATFFATLREQGRPSPDESYTPRDYALLEELAEVALAKCEERGVIGHPLAWANVRRAILGDLRAFLAADRRWRAERKAWPTYLEQGFGLGDPRSWPAAQVRVGGQTFRFRGTIDRIDLDRDQGRAWVFDYKTGSPNSDALFAEDPVAGGQHVQIALYTHVVRTLVSEVRQVGGAYWFATTKGGFKQVELSADDETVETRLVEVVEVVARGVRAGSFPQIPGDEAQGGFVNCRYCPYDRICPPRRDRVWERKQHDPVAAIASELGRDGNAEAEE
jgi:RecB family exonuclease